VSFPSFQVLTGRDANTGCANIVLYRKDQENQEWVGDIRQIKWEKFQGVLEERHKQEISIDDLLNSVLSFSSILHGHPATEGI
jgi:hypothetical protein